MKPSSLLVLALSATTLAACDGLSEAFTAHVDVAATAGSQELSVTRLADLIGNAKMQLPVNKEVATLIARDLWMPYQLLAIAAARGDSLSDAKAIDEAAVGMLENVRLSQFMQSVAASYPAAAADEAAYNAGTNDLYSARHILWLVPEGAPAPVRDSLRRVATAIRQSVTDANFAEMARKHSGDNSAQAGGDLGPFARGIMVKPFGDAVAGLKPGEISPVVETQFGFHIIQRNTWDRAKAAYGEQAAGRGRQAAESLYVAKIDESHKIEVRAGAAALMKEIAKDPISHRSDATVAATYTGGQLTGSHLALVLLATPNSGRLVQQIQAAPDSIVLSYVRQMAQRRVLLTRADSAKVTVPEGDLAMLHRDFVQAVVQSWEALGVDPRSLSDSATTPDAREKLAAARIERFMDRVMAGEAQPMPVPAPLQLVLMRKFDSKLNPAGVDRAVERAMQVRTVADSAKNAAASQSGVPLPPGAPTGAVPLPSNPRP